MPYHAMACHAVSYSAAIVTCSLPCSGSATVDPEENGRAQGDQQQEGTPLPPPIPGLKNIPEDQGHCVDHGQVLWRACDGCPVLQQASYTSTKQLE